jgi:hypothetical protein
MKKSIAWILAATACTVLALTGCRAIQKKIGEEIGEKIIENASGGDVEIDDDRVTYEDNEGNSLTYDESGDVQWPDSIPHEVPKFQGEIVSVLDVEGSTMVSFQNVNEKDVVSYIGEVKENGFSANMEYNQGETRGGVYNLESITLTVAYSKNDSSLMITCSISEE